MSTVNTPEAPAGRRSTGWAAKAGELMRTVNAERGPVAFATYMLIRLVIFGLHCFPVDLNLRTARWVGRVWWHLDARSRDRAVKHIREAFAGEISDRKVERIARRCFQHWVMFVVEIVFAPRLINERTWTRYVRLTQMDDAVRVLLQGRGAVLVTGHYGSFDFLGYLLAVYGFDIVAVMRPLPNQYLNDYVVRTRRTAGLKLLNKRGAAEQASGVIQAGGAVGFIADQDAGRKGVFVDFFGKPASAYKSIALLAMEADVPIIIGYARRVSDRFYYEIGVERIIHPKEWRDQDDPLGWITQQYTSAIESFVRAEPSQYLWPHRRWKSRPNARQAKRMESLTTV